MKTKLNFLGPRAVVKKEGMFHIGAETADGTYWVLNRRFKKDCTVKMALIARIKAAGEIDTSFWRRA